MKKLQVIFYLVCASATSLLAQADDYTFNNQLNNYSMYENVRSDAVQFYNVGLNLAQSPFQFDTNDLLLTGTILGLTAAAFPLDAPIRREIINNQSNSLDRVSFISEKFGNPKYATMLSGALYLGGLVFKDNYTRQTGQMLAEAVLFNGLITTGAKMALGRGRPFINEGSYNIELFEFENEYEETSLPSGHTSTAFTVATILSSRIDNIYASVALYSMASLTAFQRMYVDKHWFSDTILGAALGTAVGLKIVKLHSDNLTKENQIQYSIFPKINQDNYGLGFALQF